MKRIAFAVVLMAPLVVGCAAGSRYFYKAGVSRQERASDILDCKQMAYQTLPPQRMSGGGSRTQVNVGTSQGGGFAESFNRSYSQSSDAAARSRDLNAEARASFIDDCIRTKGYREVSKEEYCQLYGDEAFRVAGCN